MGPGGATTGANTAKEHKNTAQWESCRSFLENAQLQPPRKKSFTNHKHERVQEISWTTGQTRTGKEKSLTKNTINQGQLQRSRAAAGGKKREEIPQSRVGVVGIREGRGGVAYCGPGGAFSPRPHTQTRDCRARTVAPVDGGDMRVISDPPVIPALTLRLVGPLLRWTGGDKTQPEGPSRHHGHIEK